RHVLLQLQRRPRHRYPRSSPRGSPFRAGDLSPPRQTGSLRSLSRVRGKGHRGSSRRSRGRARGAAGCIAGAGCVRRPCSPCSSARGSSRAALGSVLRRRALQLHVVLKTDALQQLELSLERIDVLLFASENLLEQPPRYVVVDALAQRDPFSKRRHRHLLELQVAAQDLLDVLADQQLAEILEIR